MNQISCLPALAKSVHLHSHQHGQILKGNSIEKYEPILIIQLTSHENVIRNMLVYKSRLTIRQLTTRLQSKRKTVFNQRLICKNILNMLVIEKKIALQLYLRPLLISRYWNTWNHWSHVIHSLNKRPRRKIQAVVLQVPAKKSQRMQFIPGQCFRRIEWFWIPVTFRTNQSSTAIWFGGSS